MTALPVLIGCSHGTRSPAGQQAISALLQAVRELAADQGIADLRVVPAHVDVQEPALADVVVRETAAGAAVIVPVLLSAGFHVHTDIAAALASGNGRAVATPALGPDPRLADILVQRLAQAGADPARPVVLAAAGSSDPRAQADVAAVAAALRERRPGPVTVGYGAAALPTVADAVTAAGPAVAVVSYLLAPGHFHDLVGRCGADLVTAPLAPHPALAELVLQRFLAALPT